jgi:hypothetical protein
MSDPIPASPAQPVFPPEPWYRSEVQVRLVIASVIQVISVLLRALGRYTEVSFTSEDLDLVMADVSQLVAIGFGVLAIVSRKNSNIQPLTLTQGAAAVRAADAQLDPATLRRAA